MYRLSPCAGVPLKFLLLKHISPGKSCDLVRILLSICRSLRLVAPCLQGWRATNISHSHLWVLLGTKLLFFSSVAPVFFLLKMFKIIFNLYTMHLHTCVLVCIYVCEPCIVLLLFFFKFHLVYCGCAHMPWHTWNTEDNLWGRFLPSMLWVIGLDGKHLYLLSHLSDPL